jgi:hypothetical protein
MTVLDRPQKRVIVLFIAASLIVHLFADSIAGFHGDELLHIEAGRHLATGYMDFSPMIAFLASVQNLFHSSSLFVNHIFLYIATALIFLLCGLITIELGGTWKAVAIVLSCILLSPGFGASHSLFLPDVFDQLAWVSCLYFVVRYCNYRDGRSILLTAACAAAGFLTKYTIGFFIAGFALSALLFDISLLKRKYVWAGIGIFIVIISPNVYWQYINGFPVFSHFSELYDTQLDKLSRINELKSLILFLNPLTLPFWGSGLIIAPFMKSFRKHRLFLFTLLFSFIFLLLARGKSYYFFPVVLGLLPAGTALAEKVARSRPGILATYVAITCIAGLVLLPHGVPILRLDKYIKYYGFKPNEDGKIPLPFENYYSGPIWDNILRIVNDEYLKLPAEEQKKCLIWGRHYSQAGGINLLGRRMGLPHAFSFHSSFYEWVPAFDRDMTVIAISDSNLQSEFWLQYFDEVNKIAEVENKYASIKPWYTQNIFVCRKLKYNSSELKQRFRNEIF